MSKLIAPKDKEWLSTLCPTFEWEKSDDATAYAFSLEKLTGDTYCEVESAKITDTTYTLEGTLEENELYRWSVTAVCEDNEKSLGQQVFAAPFNPKTHPANVGMNFEFRDTISPEVLKNYHSRVITCQFLDYGTVKDDFAPGNLGNWKEYVRMILYTGAKYVLRSIANNVWVPTITERDVFQKEYKACIDFAHSIDPDIIFEACVFETAHPAFDELEIPKWVFDAFELPYEKRNFRHKDMFYRDGHYSTSWDGFYGVPDVTQLETQMWFFYRAISLLECGFEALHMGYMPAMSDIDSKQDWICYRKVFDLIRKHAKKHARRGMVLLNAHSHGFVTSDGVSLLDFNAWSVNAAAPEGSVPHAPTEDNPQEIEIRKGFGHSLYGDSASAIMPSGWYAESIPFFVELDNFGERLDLKDSPDPGEAFMFYWGTDEMGWFLRQPDWYRRQWLPYSYKRVRELDPAGSMGLPGCRCCGTFNELDGPYRARHYYRALLPEWSTDKQNCMGDEPVIRKIWVDDRKAMD